MFLRHFSKSMRKIRNRAFMDRRNKEDTVTAESVAPAADSKLASSAQRAAIIANENVVSTSSEIETLYPAETLAESGEIKTPPELELQMPSKSETLPQLALLKPNEILLSNVPEDTTLVMSAIETIFETSNIEINAQNASAIIRFETEEDALLAMEIARTFQLNEAESRHIIWCNDMMTPILRVENISRDTMEEKLFSDFPDLKSVKLKHLSHKCVAVLEFESAYIAAKNYFIAKKLFGKDAEVYHVIHSDWRKSNLPLRDPPSLISDMDNK